MIVEKLDDVKEIILSVVLKLRCNWVEIGLSDF